MRNPIMRIRSFGVAVVAAALAFPATAPAKAVLITRGDAFSHLGEINAKKDAGNALPADLAVGYKYSYFGIFWLDLWRYDGEYCLYHDKEYVPITKAQAALFLGVPEASISEPFFYHLPPGLIVVGVL